MWANRLLFIAAAAFLWLPQAAAYETDFELSGRVIVELTNTSTGDKSLEFWQIRFLRGLLPGERPITDLEIVRASLLEAGSRGFALSDLSALRYEAGLDRVIQTGSTFAFSIGIAVKHNVRLLFAPDGSLLDLDGSITSEMDPTNIFMIKLTKDARQIRIIEYYDFKDSFRFHKRTRK